MSADIVIVAPGMEWRRLELDGVEELLGHGVYYGAGRSEAVQCAGEHVMVVGAGNSAGQAVMNLASAGARVTMVVRGDSLGKSMSAYLVDRIEAHDADRGRLHTQVRELHEEAGRLGAVTIEAADSAPETIAGHGAVPLHRRRAAHRLGAGERRPDRRARASSSPGRTCSRAGSGPTTGRSTATRWRSRRASRACSPQATCGTAP